MENFERLSEPIKSREDALKFLDEFVKPNLGGGFHPDTLAEDYANADGPTFDEEEVDLFEDRMRELHDVLGPDIYVVCLERVL